jgi:altronate dehydratase
MSNLRSAERNRSPGGPQAALAIVLHERDTVAVLVRDVARGDPVTVGGEIITAEDPIPRGHKVARQATAPGEPVIKYGEVIGIATEPITRGSHVHVHNVVSARLPGPTAGGG